MQTNLKKRIIATILDYLFIFLLTYLYIMLAGQENEEGVKTLSGLVALPIPTVWFIYFVVVEAFYGATLAHQGLNLKVLTVDRKEIDFVHALKRHLLDPVDILLYGVPAIIAIKNSEKHQRLGDMWAKTIVVELNDNGEKHFSNNRSVSRVRETFKDRVRERNGETPLRDSTGHNPEVQLSNE
jgi:uncharacterized RDD family membrane protein YckC